MSNRTGTNWLSGRVRHPHHWQRLVQVAAALRLNEIEATELLQAAAQPSIAELRQQAATETEQQLLSSWPPAETAPFQAIADLPYFVGREEMLAELGGVLQNGRSVTIHSLRGMGGVGKTSLAAHLAYQLRHTFVDGVLWARLDTSDTMAILTQFAAAYGQDVSNHHDIESRAAAVRHILADKQVLIVLDNAQASSQVRPLLPPTTGKTAVIVTTRQDLAVTDEMHRHLLQSFPADSDHSLAVFTHFLGQSTVRRWRDTLQKIIALLVHLPLAIAIAAGRLATHQITIPAYLVELQTANNRLNALIREDRNVRLSFELSYQTLSPHLQQFFVALGVFGGEDFGLEAAAYVANTSKEMAVRNLDQLVQLSLVQPSRAKRYVLHSLLREFAQEKQADNQNMHRMVNYFVAYATRHVRDFSTINIELSNLGAALEAASVLSMIDAFIEGTLKVFPSWYVQGNLETAVFHLEKALIMARQTDNWQYQAHVLSFLGTCNFARGNPAEMERLHKEGLQMAYKANDPNLISTLLINLASLAGGYHSNYAQADAYLSKALQYTQQLNDPARMATLLTSLGNVAYEQGLWERAESHWREGIVLLDSQEHPDAILLRRNLGQLLFAQGEFDSAVKSLNEALAMSQTLKYTQAVSFILSTLGLIAIEQGQYYHAQQLLTEALKGGRETESPEGIAQSLAHLGWLAIHANDLELATHYIQEAISVSQAANIVWLKSVALFYRGELRLRKADLLSAREDFMEVRETADSLNIPEQKGLALFGLARVTVTINRNVAEQLGQESLAILEQMGHFKAAKVYQWLQTLKAA